MRPSETKVHLGLFRTPSFGICRFAVAGISGAERHECDLVSRLEMSSLDGSTWLKSCMQKLLNMWGKKWPFCAIPRWSFVGPVYFKDTLGCCVGGCSSAICIEFWIWMIWMFLTAVEAWCHKGIRESRWVKLQNDASLGVGIFFTLTKLSRVMLSAPNAWPNSRAKLLRIIEDVSLTICNCATCSVVIVEVYHSFAMPNVSWCNGINSSHTNEYSSSDS